MDATVTAATDAAVGMMDAFMKASYEDTFADAAVATADVVATAAPTVVELVPTSEVDLLGTLLTLLVAVATALIPVLVRYVWVRTGLDKTVNANKTLERMERIAMNAVSAAEEKAHRLLLRKTPMVGSSKLEYARKVAAALVERSGLAAWAEEHMDAMIHAKVNVSRLETITTEEVEEE